MNPGAYILELIERVASRVAAQRVAVSLIGEVTSENPLKIKIRDGYEIDEDNFVLSQFCRETWIKIPKHAENEHLHEIDAETEFALAGVTGQATEPPTGHKHTIRINTKTALPEICLWRGLKLGDEVRIIRFGGGAIHLVLERVEGVANDTENNGGDYDGIT